MDIVLTGTGSPLPDADRAGPSTLVKTGGTQVLIDAGRGVVMRLAGAGSVPAWLSGVLITHLHSDHICALNDVITTHWVMTRGATPLPIFGPVGTAEFVARQLHALEFDVSYRIAHHEELTVGPQVAVTELQPDDVIDVGDIRVTTAPTLGYRLEHEGASAAIVGDTLPCEGVDALADGVDAYVQTVIRPGLVELIDNDMIQVIVDYHSSVVDAAKTAARVAVQRLVLTHMIPSPGPGQEREWLDAAAEHYDGEIVIGGDLTTITV